MNLRQHRRQTADINLTALIDVVFLLLIFFMVSTTFNRESAISINLPAATVQAQEPDNEAIEITIDSEGQFYVNQQRVINTQLATLKRALKIAAGDNKEPSLILSADANTPHQAVIKAMDAARQLGFIHLSISTKSLPGGR